MRDDQRKGEGLRSDDDGDGDGGDGLSFLLGLVFFSMVVVIISLSSVWGFGSILKSHGDMMVMVKGEEDQTIEEGLDLW